MTRLLVSVRSATEAVAALAGGADVIDVKEPANGSLGRASAETIAEVLRVVGGRRPVSAALGEFGDINWDEPLPEQLSYLKWGFSHWRERSLGAIAHIFDRLHVELPERQLVTVAYADWQRAGAPMPDELCRLACAGRWGPMLIDTWRKDGSTLLDFLPLATLTDLRKRCQMSQVPLALAGSLGLAEMRILLPLEPEWFAVRGAVCRERDRTAEVDEHMVRELADWLGVCRFDKVM
jgi:uncharacterized protein (UPF0264 family)